MSRSQSIAVWFLAGLPLGFWGIWRLQHSIDSQMSSLHEEKDEVLLTSGTMIKGMSLEYAPLMADVYWTRVVQYYGSKGERHEQSLDRLWPLLDLTTTLDANLIPPYRFGSTFLAEQRPVGAERPDLAIALIERGIRANPKYWRLYQDLGNVYYFALSDKEKAAAAYNEGSKVAGAEPWMKIMAARIVERGDTRQTSRLLWTEIYQSSDDASLKENAKMHLILLQTDDDRDAINLKLEEFAKRYGHVAEDMRELVNAGLFSALPVDPEKYPYVIGPAGRAAINLKSPLHAAEPMYRKF